LPEAVGLRLCASLGLEAEAGGLARVGAVARGGALASAKVETRSWLPEMKCGSALLGRRYFVPQDAASSTRSRNFVKNRHENLARPTPGSQERLHRKPPVQTEHQRKHQREHPTRISALTRIGTTKPCTNPRI